MIRRLIILLLIVGCVPNPYNLTVESYQEQSPKINLGMTKYEVSQILSPTQELLPTPSIKERGMYMRDSIFTEIIYYRSKNYFSDGIDTDDEYTPYIFENSVLVAVGWETIVGYKSQAQTRSIKKTVIINENSNQKENKIGKKSNSPYHPDNSPYKKNPYTP